MTNTILINDNGNNSIFAEYQEHNMGTDLEFTGLRITINNYRINELKRLCDERGYIVIMSPVFAGKLISEIKGIKTFWDVMDLIIEFRKNFN